MQKDARQNNVSASRRPSCTVGEMQCVQDVHALPNCCISPSDTEMSVMSIWGLFAGAKHTANVSCVSLRCFPRLNLFSQSEWQLYQNIQSGDLVGIWPDRQWVFSDLFRNQRGNLILSRTKVTSVSSPYRNPTKCTCTSALPVFSAGYCLQMAKDCFALNQKIRNWDFHQQLSFREKLFHSGAETETVSLPLQQWRIQVGLNPNVCNFMKPGKRNAFCFVSPKSTRLIPKYTLNTLEPPRTPPSMQNCSICRNHETSFPENDKRFAKTTEIGNWHSQTPFCIAKTGGLPKRFCSFDFGF